MSQKKATSEDLHNISAEPDDIRNIGQDAYREVDDAQRALRGFERASEDELRDVCNTIESSLGSLRGYNGSGLIEDMEERGQEFQNWGAEWRNYALYLFTQNEELQAQLEESKHLEQLSSTKTREIHP